MLRRTLVRRCLSAPLPELIDSHCHLNHRRLIKEVGQAVALERAAAANVTQLVTISCELSERDELIALCRQNPKRVFCSVGVHPHCSGSATTIEAAKITQRLLDDKKAFPEFVVAFGECGLDYFKNFSPRDAQMRVFRAHLEAAIKADVPVVIHSRDCDEDLISVLKEYNGKIRGVLHCFNGGRPMAEAGIKLGLHISISGIVTFKRGDSELKQIIREVIPMDRLLVETDAPFLAPHPHRGKPGQPAFVADTALAVSKILAMDLDVFAAHTVTNTRRLFGMPPPSS